MQTFWGICAISNIYSRQKKIFVIGKIKQPSLIHLVQYLKTYNMLHDFLCLFVKKKKKRNLIANVFHSKNPLHNNNHE